MCLNNVDYSIVKLLLCKCFVAALIGVVVVFVVLNIIKESCYEADIILIKVLSLISKTVWYKCCKIDVYIINLDEDEVWETVDIIIIKKHTGVKHLKKRCYVSLFVI